MDAASERAQFGQGRVGLILDRVQVPDQFRAICQIPCHGELYLDLHEALLRTIVEVLLDPASFPLGRVHEPGPRRAQLPDEARVLKQQ